MHAISNKRTKVDLAEKTELKVKRTCYNQNLIAPAYSLFQ